MSILSTLKPSPGSKKKANRVGRGIGSGSGKTCGRGQKGQGARSGSGGRRAFEGGQTALMRRLPKRGFNNVHAAVVVNINVGQLETFDAGTEVTVEALRERGLLKGQFDKVKILGNGDLTKKLTVKAHGFSAGAVAKIEKAGGNTTVVSRKGRHAASEKAAD